MSDPQPTFFGIPFTSAGGSGPFFDYVLATKIEGIEIALCHYNPTQGCGKWSADLIIGGVTVLEQEVDQDREVVLKRLEDTYRALYGAINRANPNLPLLQEAHRQEHGAPPGSEVEGRPRED